MTLVYRNVLLSVSHPYLLWVVGGLFSTVQLTSYRVLIYPPLYIYWIYLFRHEVSQFVCGHVVLPGSP